MTRTRPATVVAALAVVAAVAVACFLPTPAAQAASYRYWTYWIGGNGDWAFSTRGADRIPADGSVDGWRFAISQEAGSSSAKPSIPSTFNAICGDTEAVDGRKRVGLVIDYGTRGDAPPGESPPSAIVARCLVLPLSANGYDMLVAVTSIRAEQGMICGISGYPRSGCGESVRDPEPNNTTGPGGDDDSGSGNGTPGTSNDQPEGADPAATSQPGADPSRSNEPDKSNQKHDRNDDQSNSPSGATPRSPTNQAEEDADIAAALATDVVETEQPSSPVGVLVGLGVVLAIVLVGILVVRRRR